MANFIQNLRAAVNRVRETVFRRLFRARFRYDVFISYSHSDAKEYAFNLKQQLSNLDFACFIDKEEAPPGLSLGPALEKALKRSAVLVLLATERALTRPYIHQEFETFVAAGRKIIPINILDALTRNNEEALTTAPWKIIKDQKLIWIDETAEAFAKQQPSPPIADGIDKLFKYTRRNVRVRTEIIGTAVLVLLAAFGAGFVIKGQAAEVAKQASLAVLARQETQTQQTIAAEAKKEADKQLLLAGQAKQDAEKQGRLADEARDEATRQQQIAKEATAEATRQQLLARQATLEAQRQQAIAEQQLQRSRNLLYDSDINLAQRVQERGDMTRLSEFLNNHVPNTAAKDQSDLRGFEWFYYWRLANYKPEILGPVDYVGEIQISQDGKVLAAAGDSGQLKIWQLNGPRKSVEVKAHRDSITSVAISWDGTTVATASADTTIKIWDIRTREVKLIKTLQNDRVRVNAVVFSRDGKTLVTGGSNKILKIWDLEKATPLMTSSPYTESVFYPAISPDGNTLVTYDDKTIKLQSTEPPYQMIDEVLTNEKIGCVAFSADGTKLIAGVTGKVRIMSWPDYRDVRLLDAPASACPVALSGDASTMTMLGDKIYLWNVLPWAPLGSFNVAGWFFRATLTPDGKKIAVRRSSDVMLWDVRGIQEQATVHVENAVDQIAFSSSGKMFAVLSNKTVGLWDTETRKALPRLNEERFDTMSMALSRGGRIATGYEDGNVTLWNMETREPSSVFKLCAKEVLALSFSPDEQTLAAGCSDGTIQLWNTRAQKLTLNGHSGPIRSLVFASDGKLASGSDDKTVRVWNGATGQQLWMSDAHKDGILAVAFSSDAKKLASASKDKTVKLWDVSTAKELVILVGHKFEVSAVAFSPDGKTVATGGEDKTIKLWDPNTGQERTTFTQHTSRVAAVAFSPDGRTLATGSWDRTVKLWFAATDEEVNAAAQRKP
ncbi:MAG TPA: TIR domain-containing protein [Pyrinomonadaceae bacterium]|nr:TIR domain-containing protein [Pyrinomonadaceae bacterium]